MSRIPLRQLGHCAGEDQVCVWCGEHLPREWKAWKLKCRVGFRDRLRWLQRELLRR